MDSWLTDSFPHLASEPWVETSPESSTYNCIAWAAGDTEKWWWPHPMAYWPEGVERTVTIHAFMAALGTCGYTPCGDDSLEPGVEKVALYELHGKPTHAARQLESGQWASKLGKSIDIIHTLRGLEDSCYGKVCLILSRPGIPVTNSPLAGSPTSSDNV
jgi:hypothetical protein